MNEFRDEEKLHHFRGIEMNIQTWNLLVKKIRNILTKILRLNPGLGIRDTADPLIESYFSHLQLKSIIGNKFHSPIFSSKG